MIKLTEAQKSALPGVEWLISDERGVGKTTLLAYAFIRKAITTGKKVYPFDHQYNGTSLAYANNKQTIYPTIKRMALDWPGYEFVWYDNDASFTMKARS